MVYFRVMDKNDLDFFMQLMDMVGWGMTPSDYYRLLEFSPEGCFIADYRGKDVGMVASTNYGDIAWIGNLVVVPETRGLGIGAALMEYAMRYLESTGTRTIKLDSVQLAIPLYHRLGFRDEYWSHRFNGVAAEHNVSQTQVMKQHDLGKVAILDESVFKAPRKSILEYVYDIFPDLCFTSWSGDQLIGYIMAKRGMDTIRIGPWIAIPGYEERAEELLYSVMNQCLGEKIWVGVPEGNKKCIEVLEKNGFTTLPSSLRMCYGDCIVVEDIESVYGLGGPDKG